MASLTDYLVFRDPAWPVDERAGSILFVTLDGLVLPELAADESVRNVTGPAQPEDFLPIPIDFPAWVDAVENVSVVDEGVIEAPGSTVRWWDVVVDPEAGPTFRCGADTADCVGSFVTPPEAVAVAVLQVQDLQRIYLVDEMPDVVGFAKARESGYFDRSVEIAEMLLADLRAGA